MGIALTTAGVTLRYAVETVKGTRPTSGYKIIPDIKSTPEFNPEPESLETTTLAETEFKTYTPALKDLGGALPFTANYTNEFITSWGEVVSAYDEAVVEEKAVWFEINHPKLENSLYINGKPSELGLPAMEVNSVMEISAYITPLAAPVKGAKSTNE